MKRTGDLFDEFCSFENLYLASQKARRNKRYKDSTTIFDFNLEHNLLIIRKLLKKNSFTFGKYTSFYIYDPKKRLINAAPYRDRVVHHAICNIIEPIFEKMFIYDLYSNRTDKGTHKAVNRYQDFCRKNTYVLKCDIRKYFDSIDKAILFKLICKKIKDHRFLKVIRDVIYSYDLHKKGSSTGIPLGNLTSQYFANIYLNELDHYIKEHLKCKYYIRYTDDFVVFDDSKSRLHDIKSQIQDFLKEYKLELHPHKSQVRKVCEGVVFLGYRIFPSYRLINKQNIKRFRKRTKKQQILFKKGLITVEKLKQSVMSWIAHLSHSDSYKLKKRILKEFIFTKG